MPLGLPSKVPASLTERCFAISADDLIYFFFDLSASAFLSLDKNHDDDDDDETATTKQLFVGYRPTQSNYPWFAGL